MSDHKADDKAKRFAEFKQAAADGLVVIGNSAAKADKGNGSVRAWVNKRSGVFGVEYSLPGFGFGGFDFKLVDLKPNEMDPDNVCPTGRIFVNSECMSRGFVKAVMCRLIDEADWDEEPSMTGPAEV